MTQPPIQRALSAFVVLAAAALCGCATGEGSFLAGQDDGGSSDVAEESSPLEFEASSPGLLAASGNALLPGSRAAAGSALLGNGVGSSPANAALAGVRPAAGGLAGGGLTVAPGASVSVSGPLTSPTVALAGGVAPVAGVQTTAGLSGGPLLGIGGGAPSVLGASTTGNILGVPAGVTATSGLGVTPQGATTNLLVGLTTPASTGTPVRMPSTVPGAVPLTTLIPLLARRGG